MSSRFKKDPDATLDYQINWSDWLDTDTISASSWIVPTGLTEGTGALAGSFTDTVTTVWLSSGVVATVYSVVNRITTTAGRIDDRTIKITIKEK